jgi:hypothetical protein
MAAPLEVGDAEVLHSERRRHVVELPERDIALSCLTEAARALRRSVGREDGPEPFAHADDAYRELEVVQGLRLNEPREAAQKELDAGLDLAVERVGPLPGGRISRPGGRPTEEVRPTQEDLVDMGRHAGASIGILAALGEASALEALRAVIKVEG